MLEEQLIIHNKFFVLFNTMEELITPMEPVRKFIKFFVHASSNLAFVLVLQKEGNCVKLPQFQSNFQSMNWNSTMIPLVHKA